MKRRLLGVAAALAVIGLIGGVAFAATSDDGTIKACALKATGMLRLDSGKGCLGVETPIQWSKTGPPGPQGPPGTSHVDERYLARSLADVSSWLPIVTGVWPDVRPNMTHILTAHYGPGTYSITAEVVAGNYSGEGVVVCLLGNPSVGYAVGQSAVGNAAGFAVQQTFEFQSVFPLPQGGDLELSCFNAPPNDPSVGNPTIGLADVLATKVDTFTSTAE